MNGMEGRPAGLKHRRIELALQGIDLAETIRSGNIRPIPVGIRIAMYQHKVLWRQRLGA